MPDRDCLIGDRIEDTFLNLVFHEELEALGRRIRAKKKSSLIKVQNLTYKSLRNLEDRWQQLYLRSIEWEVCIEQLLSSSSSQRRVKSANNSREQNSSWEHTDEPARKYRRLSLPKDEQSAASLETSEHILMDTSVPPEDLCPPQSNNNASQTFLSNTASFTRMVDLSSLTSDSEKNNSDSQQYRHSIDLSRFSFDENIFAKDASIFNNSERSAHNHAIIYHKHEDTVSESSEVKSFEISSDDETSWAYDSTAEETRNTSSSLTKKSQKVDELKTEGDDKIKCQDSNKKESNPNDTNNMPSTESYNEPCNKTFKTCSKLPGTSSQVVDKSIKKLVTYAELLVRRVPKAKRYQHNSSHSQEEKFMPVDSCDASGEYTTEDDETCDTYSSEENTRQYEDQSTPKIIFRSKSLRADRPRSMSILSHPHTTGLPLLATYSNSESALHTISLSQSVRTESSLNSSSTIEESCHCNRSPRSSQCDRSASSSLKKSRKKHRRLRRSGLGSADNLSGKCARSSHTINRTYVLPQELPMSESMSGHFSRHLSFSGDNGMNCDLRTPNNTTDAEMETEEEVLETLSDEKKKTKKKVLPVVPNFIIGKSTNSFPANKLLGDFTSGAEEQTSSFGTIPDEAWDNYQEKYHSEAYSEELPDTELLNQTLHFGEDYGSFIDRNSDWDSSVMGSDSEEDVEKFVSKCKFKFQWFETVDPSLLNKTKLQRLCRDIIQKLRNVSEKLDDVAEIKELMKKYEEFESKLIGEENLTKNVEKELDLLKKEYMTLECRVTNIEDKNELINKILEIEEKKDKLSLVSGSMQVGSFLSPQEAEHLYNKLEERHKYFTKLATTWERLESDLIHFQTDVQQEVEKLKKEMGKSAEFINGLIRQEMSIIQDPEAFQNEVTKVLSEQSAVDFNQGYNLYHMAIPNCEGSDSGISDSEHDCERNRKLSDLKKLQEDLDSVLSSNKKTLIAKKMDETEAELRKLKNLRRLVFHSTMFPQAVAEATEADSTQRNEAASTTGSTAPWNISRNRKNRTQLLAEVVAPAVASLSKSASTDSPDKIDPPHKSNSHLWRILKSALPFHFAIIVIACVVWLLEPNCCDNLNNLNLSGIPQLKYTEGPPPI